MPLNLFSYQPPTPLLQILSHSPPLTSPPLFSPSLFFPSLLFLPLLSSSLPFLPPFSLFPPLSSLLSTAHDRDVWQAAHCLQEGSRYYGYWEEVPWHLLQGCLLWQGRLTMYIIVPPFFSSSPSYCYTMLKCFSKQQNSPPVLTLPLLPLLSLSLSLSLSPSLFFTYSSLFLPPRTPHFSSSSSSSSSPHLSLLFLFFLLSLPTPITPSFSFSLSFLSLPQPLTPLPPFTPLSLLPLFKPFGDDHEKQYIYKEPHVTKISELTLRLQKLYSKKFGPELVHIIQESGKVRVCER